MKVGDKFTLEIYPENTAEITIMSVDDDGYRYEIAFSDGRKAPVSRAGRTRTLCPGTEPTSEKTIAVRGRRFPPPENRLPAAC